MVKTILSKINKQFLFYVTKAIRDHFFKKLPFRPFRFASRRVPDIPSFPFSAPFRRDVELGQLKDLRPSSKESQILIYDSEASLNRWISPFIYIILVGGTSFYFGSRSWWTEQLAVGNIFKTLTNVSTFELITFHLPNSCYSSYLIDFVWCSIENFLM